MNMAAEHSAYTYKSGEQETVTLRHGTADPHGHALLRINHDDGKTLDCYVNTAWLRDRLNDLGEPCPVPAAPRALTPDAITDEAVHLVQERIKRRATYIPAETIRLALEDAFAPKRPEGAESWEDFLIDSLDYQALTDQQITDLADRIAEETNR